MSAYAILTVNKEHLTTVILMIHFSLCEYEEGICDGNIGISDGAWGISNEFLYLKMENMAYVVDFRTSIRLCGSYFHFCKNW